MSRQIPSVEINLSELKTMVKEFWAIDNNSTCLKASIIFLKRIGLIESQIKRWIDLRNWDKEDYTTTKEDENEYLEKVEDTQNYDMDEFEPEETK